MDGGQGLDLRILSIIDIKEALFLVWRNTCISMEPKNNILGNLPPWNRSLYLFSMLQQGNYQTLSNK